jgi:hypothetical protein
MARRLIGLVDTGLHGTKVPSGTLRREVQELALGNNPRVFYERYEGFDGATLPSPWATAVTGAVGVPTVAKVANTPCGVWRLTLAATSEAETARIDFGDSLMLNDPTAAGLDPNPIGVPNFEIAFRIPTALTTAQGLVIGLATAFNATLTSITKYAWLRFTANMAPLLEGKDGTTTTLAQAVAGGTAMTLLAATWYLATFEIGQGRCKMSIDDQVLGTVPMGALVATDVLQPMCCLLKTTGVTTPTLDVDWAVVRNWAY